MTIQEFVSNHVERGECKCGRCCDAGNAPDPAHAIDMVFFKVAKVGDPSVEDFDRLTRETKGDYGPCDPFDGKDHGYIELGAWIGDQGLAMCYMALGVMLGKFNLLAPAMLGIPNDSALGKQMIGQGFLSVMSKKKAPELQVQLTAK